MDNNNRPQLMDSNDGQDRYMVMVKHCWAKYTPKLTVTRSEAGIDFLMVEMTITKTCDCTDDPNWPPRPWGTFPDFNELRRGETWELPDGYGWMYKQDCHHCRSVLCYCPNDDEIKDNDAYVFKASSTPDQPSTMTVKWAEKQMKLAIKTLPSCEKKP